ncbi:TetR/AcrR family transcriptional regulator [Anaeromyxobacter oryzisoli]|uniref:TetR/AcrR family transcriptional regulator n=1 Tax=Anaeromyxobacter oryzisoli TaxID=2925408 RepID=UPI001F585E4C|nr:TetR/AcrR family transcriptional regulator [Anaeromyxobacter sp. SG63]
MTGKARTDHRPGRARDAQATRAALLRAATAVFADDGYAGARVDAIARRARVNKRMIYAYFGDKQGIYREVLAARLAVPPFSKDEHADPRAAVTALVRWYFHLLSDDPAFARLLAWGLLSGDAHGRAIMRASAAPALDFLTGVIRRGVASGAFRSDANPEMIATTLVSLCLGYFLQHDAMVAARGPRGRWTDEAFLEGLYRVVFDGIAGRGAA